MRSTLKQVPGTRQTGNLLRAFYNNVSNKKARPFLIDLRLFCDVLLRLSRWDYGYPQPYALPSVDLRLTPSHKSLAIKLRSRTASPSFEPQRRSAFCEMHQIKKARPFLIGLQVIPLGFFID
jgi:hypothetical protein